MNKFLLIFAIAALFLSGCSATNDEQKAQIEPYKLRNSYLSTERKETESTDVVIDEDVLRKSGFERVESIELHNVSVADKYLNSTEFSGDTDVTIAANAMPASEFLHYAFGEVLGTNYVLANDLKDASAPITLNIQNPISKSELFSLVANILAEQQISIDYNEGVFYFQGTALGKAKAVIGIGRTISSVPQTSGQILQIIPTHYGVRLSLERTIRNLVEADITPDFEQNAIFVMGTRANVLRTIELVQLLDVPANRGKYIGMLSLQYIAMQEFIEQATTLLTNEGISTGINNENNRSVLLVPLSNLGSVAIFANSEEILRRVRYWAEILDKPAQGENAQYFVYSPNYARAVDLGQSIGQLLGIANPVGRSANSSSTGQNASALQSETVSSSSSNIVSNADLSFVVDERSNTLIFNTTGDNYLKLLPLLNRLDILPKQILLEVMIAEVTLTDDFKFGVEFALKNNEKFNISTLGAFGAGSTGGIVGKFIDQDLFTNTRGEVAASFFRENRLVNVLSNPTLLVRDGMTATISVGTEIPTLGGTAVDDGVQTTSINYRRTGVDLSVTPTVNAQGVVIMNIDQSISNTVETTAEAASPSIFDRSLQTEAVVESGQTVILGGLISENSSVGETKVPVLGDLPLIGNVFKGQNDSKTKTELVMIVTPRVIESSEEWDKLLTDFQNGLENIQFEK